MGNYDTAPFGMKLSWVHRVRWHEIHWYLTVFACRPDKRPWGLVCPFPDRDRSSLSCVIRVFFHQLTAGIRAQNAHHYIGDSWVGKSDSSVCWWNTAAHLFDCVGVFRDIWFLWRQCCPFDSAFSVNHIRFFWHSRKRHGRLANVRYYSRTPYELLFQIRPNRGLQL